MTEFDTIYAQLKNARNRAGIISALCMVVVIISATCSIALSANAFFHLLPAWGCAAIATAAFGCIFFARWLHGWALKEREIVLKSSAELRRAAGL